MKKTPSQSKNTTNPNQTLSDLQTRLKDKYIVGAHLGKGAFGTIYHLTSHKEKNVSYAAKCINFENESSSKKKSSLTKEHSISQKLSGEPGFPVIKDYIVEGEKEVLIMSLLGSSLQAKFLECGSKLSLKTILMIGYQAIERLETLHSHGFIHRHKTREFRDWL